MRTYNRMELENLLHTSRTDSIKRSLSRAGYTFTSKGRGKNYSITITGMPDKFKEFAENELYYGEKTNFEGLKYYLYLLFYDEEFCYFAYEYQAQVLKEKYNISVCGETLRNWKKHLKEYLFITDDNEKYFACKSNQKPREVDRAVHKEAWAEFYKRLENQENAADLRREMYYKYDGVLRKRYGFAENAIEQDKLNRLKQILEETIH